MAGRKLCVLQTRGFYYSLSQTQRPGSLSPLAQETSALQCHGQHRPLFRSTVPWGIEPGWQGKGGWPRQPGGGSTAYVAAGELALQEGQIPALVPFRNH